MRKKIFTFLLALAASVGMSWAAPAVAVNGKLPGAFSVDESTVVYFSQGNLQYTKSTGKWKIMDHQYDVVETLSQNVGTDYASQDVITLFGWGTSGWDNTAADATSVHYQPYSTCKTNHSTAINNYQYGPSNANVVGSSKAASAESWSKSDSYKNYDWGVFNSGDLGSGWRVLTTQEWGYLFNTRTPGSSVNGVSNARYTEATINTDGTAVNGIILFPDDATLTTVSGVTWGTINGTSAWGTTCTTAGWEALEAAGCVFLPAASYRDGTSVYDDRTRGFYWSSSAYSANYAWCLDFYSGSVNPQGINGRYDGCSVRLVSETAPTPEPVGPTYLDADFAIDFMSDPYTVVGGGALPTGVEVAGDFHDAQHGYSSPVITIPVTAGNYLVKMGACQYSNQDGSVKNEDGSVTYTTLATNTGVCYDADPSKNYVADIITIPSDQIIKVYGAEYTPYFSIEKMPEIPAFTDFEINFMSDPYGMISGAKPEGTVIAGSFHDGDHGYQNVEVTVPMKAGKYRLTLGACQFGNGAGNVMSETNIELASFDQNLGENKCYHQDPAENIISMIFDVDQDQTITIDCGQYTPYMKLEAVTSYVVEFALGDAEGTAPTTVDVTIGEDITMPVNKTMYKPGYTLTGWSDGVNTYPIGQPFTPANDVVLTPVFTANQADLLNASSDVTVKWYFGGDNGAPTTSYEGTSGLLVAQATIGDKTVDVKLAIDATEGRFAPQSTTEWANVKVGTIFTYPYKEGMTVNVGNYKSYVTYYIADAEGKVTCGENDTYSFIEVTYPASAPAPASSVTAARFVYNYDCQRNPPFPKVNNACNLSGFKDPYEGYKGYRNGNIALGPWKLEFVAYYTPSNNYGCASQVNEAVYEYYSDLSYEEREAKKLEMPIFRLWQYNLTAQEFQPAAYGLVCAYAGEANAQDHAALFVSSNGMGCFLSGHQHTSSFALTCENDLTTGLAALVDAASAPSDPYYDVVWPVIVSIDAIGTVELSEHCKYYIEGSRAAYNALTDEQKAQVTNYSTLTNAETQWADLAAAAQPYADAVIDLINAIPNPVVYTQDCKDAIDAAQAAYDALTDGQKILVTNAETLLQAPVAFINAAPYVHILFKANGNEKKVENVTLPREFPEAEMITMLKELYGVEGDYNMDAYSNSNADAVNISYEEWTIYPFMGEVNVHGNLDKFDPQTGYEWFEFSLEITLELPPYGPAPASAVVIGDPNNVSEVETFLTTYDGQTIDELIIDRPVLNNMYNTLCLPFDMNAAQIAASSLNGVEIREFTGASVEGTTLNLSVGDPVNAVVAGRPYFVKYSAASQLDDLHFEDVTINNALLDNMAVTFDGVTFKGTFTPFVMPNGLNFQGGYLFLGQNNQLFWPNTSNPLKPFRAYFYVDVESSTPGNAPKYRGMPARIVEGKNVATGVENAQSANQSTKVIVNGQLIIIKNDVRYNAQGQVVK